MASYLAEVWELLRDDPRLDFALCLRRPEHYPGDWQACRSLLPLREVARPITNLLPWDLVVMADHAGAFRAFATPERHAVLRISHGIGGKRSGDEDYFFGRRCLNAQGKPLYSCLFESSSFRKEQALRSHAEIGRRMVVIGSLRADRIQRARAKAGFREKPRVLVASSWGPKNLFKQLGEPLLNELVRLSGRFDFVLRPHPNLLSTKANERAIWLPYFEAAQKAGLGYSDPATSAETALAEADWLISDDLSSMGLLAALAGLRVAIFPTGSESVGTDSFLASLRDCSPCLRRIDELERTLETLGGGRQQPGLAELCREMNSEPGRSTTLARREIYRLLALPPPAS